MCDEFGGLFSEPDNLSNPSGLEYILTVIEIPEEQYVSLPTLKEKAAALAFHIITRHVFYDGNKRTASHIAWEFLRSNGIKLYLDQSIIELSLAIAESTATQNQLLQWLHSHQ